MVMKGFKGRIYSQCKTSSCSTRLLGIIFPLIVVAVLVALTDSKSSNWLLGPGYYPWAWSSVFPTLRFSNYSSTAAVDKNVESWITKNSSNVFLSFNDTRALPSSPRTRRRFTNLQTVEMKLQRARAAIKDAVRGKGTHDPDYVPTGPIYWNAPAFHRSYLEMEKQFKIFVYKEGEPPLFHDGPCGGTYFMEGVYSTEGNFIHHLEKGSKFRTRNPENAHVYFLPFSVTFISHFVPYSNAYTFIRKVKQIVIDYIDLVAGRYPYWNRSRGGDHLMLGCYDWGPLISSAVPDLYNNSIRALCNANTSEGFRPSKDVSIPEIFRPGGKTYGVIGGLPPSERHILAFFAGGLHGPIRPILLEHWENKDPDIQVHEYLPKNVSYIDIMKKSKYCLCPSGYEVASPRMPESLYTGCVPVIIKDHYVAPYSDVLNWKSFSVEVPVEEIPNLKNILMAISTEQYLSMYRGGLQARRHFEVNVIPKRYDNFHMTLHSIWLRRLNIRVDAVEDT